MPGGLKADQLTGLLKEEEPARNPRTRLSTIVTPSNQLLANKETGRSHTTQLNLKRILNSKDEHKGWKPLNLVFMRRFYITLLFDQHRQAPRSKSAGFSVPISKTDLVAVKMHVASQQHNDQLSLYITILVL
jgi:hypothetical protein